MVQPDVKRLVAYSSVAHMGFVILGMFSFTEWGMQGALYQMLSHGVTTGALFLLVGFIYERRHTRQITEFGGLANVMPIYATIFVITTMSSVGLPFLNGFVGEFLIMVGMWQSQMLERDRDVELELRRHDARRNGRDLCGRLYALDGAACFLWQGHK